MVRDYGGVRDISKASMNTYMCCFASTSGAICSKNNGLDRSLTPRETWLHSLAPSVSTIERRKREALDTTLSQQTGQDEHNK